MPRKCGVPGCKSNYEKTIAKYGTVSTFCFPQSPSLRKAWLKAIGRPEWNPSQYAGVCRLHFTNNCFDVLKSNSSSNKRRPKYRLKNFSIPTKNLPLEPYVEKYRRTRAQIEEEANILKRAQHLKNVCCIVSCDNTSKQFYLFPSNPIKLEKWLESVSEYSKGSHKILKNTLICIKHFEKKYLKRDNSLTDNAVPTLNLKSDKIDKDEEFEGEEQSDISDYNDVIESFNSSYPSFDENSMVEVLEICESDDDEDVNFNKMENKNYIDLEIDIHQKVSIVEAFQKNISMEEISKQCGLPYSTIKEILHDSENVLCEYNKLTINSNEESASNLIKSEKSPKSPLKCFQNLTLSEKVNIINEYNKSELANEICKKYKISLPTLKNIVNLQDELCYLQTKMPTEFHFRTRMPTSDYKVAIDSTTIEWIKRCIKRGISVNDELLKNIGNDLRDIVPFSEFRSSNRWVERLKKKYQIDNMITESPRKVAPKLHTCGESLVLKDIIIELYKTTTNIITDRVFQSICKHNKWECDVEMESQKSSTGLNHGRLINSYKEAILFLRPLKLFSQIKQCTAANAFLKQIEDSLQNSLLED